MVLQNITILNAAQSKVTFIDANPNGWGVDQNTNSSNPTILYTPYYEDVETLDITIINTQDGKPPSNVVLGIFGCANPKKTNTKAQIEPTKTAGVTSSKTFFPNTVNIVVIRTVCFSGYIINSRSFHSGAT